jgi:hypothetical protein
MTIDPLVPIVVVSAAAAAVLLKFVTRKPKPKPGATKKRPRGKR